MARARDAALSLEEKLVQALVPDEEQPYEVPENWCWASVGSINMYSSKSIDPATTPEENYELYSVPSSMDNYPEIVKGKEIGSTKQSVAKEDVLLCKINPRINRVWKVFDFTSNSLIASSEWIIIRNAFLNSDYLMHCFRAPFFRDYMLSHVSGVGGSLMRAQPKHVQTYPIPLPPLPEQHRIVEQIERLYRKLDEAEERAQAVIDSYEDRCASILHRAFTGKLTEEWRQSHPDSSVQDVTIASVCRSLKYGTAKKSKASGEIVVLRMGNLQNGEIDWTDLAYSDDAEDNEKYKLFPGDVLFNRTNSAEKVGKTSIYRGEHAAIYAGYIIKLDYDHSILTGDYLNYMLNTPETKEYCNQVKTDGVNQSNINAKKIGAFIIPLRGMAEQAEIVRILDSLLSIESAAKAAAERAISQIDTMKKSILARAFRGELGTNDPEDEPAIELLKRTLTNPEV